MGSSFSYLTQRLSSVVAFVSPVTERVATEIRVKKLGSQYLDTAAPRDSIKRLCWHSFRKRSDEELYQLEESLQYRLHRTKLATKYRDFLGLKYKTCGTFDVQELEAGDSTCSRTHAASPSAPSTGVQSDVQETKTTWIILPIDLRAQSASTFATGVYEVQTAWNILEIDLRIRYI